MLNLNEIKELKAMGFTNEQIVEMCKETPEVAHANAKDTPAQAKYFVKADNKKAREQYGHDVVMVRDGNTCTMTYASGNPPTSVPAYKADVHSAIHFVNKKLVLEHFGDKVEYKKPRGGDWCYVCESEKVAKQLEKFELRQGVTKAEWNAWCEYKYDAMMQEAQKFEDKKVK